MILYHGSNVIVEKPIYGYGKTYNDYGRGFYCTENIDLAMEWSCPLPRDGYVNKYELDIDSLNILNLSSDKYNILNWLALLLKNREFDLNRNKEIAILGKEYIINNFLIDTSSYDVIIGYRADDRYFAFAKDFLENAISLNKLALAMKLGNLGEQIVLMSKKAFDSITFIEYEKTEYIKYYYERKNRELLANDTFNKMHTNRDILNDELYIRDIIREGIKNNDRRIY